MLRLMVTGLVVVVVAGCSSTGTSASPSAPLDPYITVVEPAERKTAPVLSGEDLSGNILSTADFAGKTMVVNLWGPWCGPCRAEAPLLSKVSAEYADQDVQFVGIVNDAKADEASAFNRNHDITYPNFADQSGRLEMGFNDSLPTQAVPTTWIIDSHGKVAVRIADPTLTKATLSGLLDDVISEG
ncbi:TlpA family protein disulfide reductase [Aeromicrobium sp. UC242_57]|uniref:TlpA family protein disulfide reductase n=1 Tax=Aeromicrobium sp. UC242_57 TaxID=3374624 RepID=UPI0037905B90